MAFNECGVLNAANTSRTCNDTEYTNGIAYTLSPSSNSYSLLLNNSETTVGTSHSSISLNENGFKPAGDMTVTVDGIKLLTSEIGVTSFGGDPGPGGITVQSTSSMSTASTYMEGVGTKTINLIDTEMIINHRGGSGGALSVNDNGFLTKGVVNVSGSTITALNKSSNQYGIRTNNGSVEVRVEDSAIDVGGTGISAYDRGGVAEVNVENSEITSTFRDGINFSSGVNVYRSLSTNVEQHLTIANSKVTAQNDGIAFSSPFMGALPATSRSILITESEVTGSTGSGILVNTGTPNSYYQTEPENDDGNTDIEISGGSVIGGTNGIRTVIGGAGLATIAISDEAVIEGGDDTAIFNNFSNSDVDITSGSIIRGGITLGDGNDDLTLSEVDVATISFFDGGDEVTTADGWVDTLALESLSAPAVLTGANVRNWESIVLDNSEVTFTDGVLTTGSEAGYGLTAQNAAVLEVSGGFGLTGNLNNNASVTSQDDNAGDTISVSGDYAADGGKLVLDTVLNGDDSATDRLVIGGDTSGATALVVNNVGGTGALTKVGILVVDVAGVSDGSFMLDSIINGAEGWSYSLVKGDGTDGRAIGDWYLINNCAGTASLGCVTNDTLSANGSTAVAGNIEGAGGSDIITVSGNASVAGVVMGGGAGVDGSGDQDTGDSIIIDTTGTVGGIQGNLGDDTITATSGTITSNTEGNDGNDTITLEGATGVAP
ncbi:autotransporter outer membrane beta-barrel domain-containing protein [Paracoccus albus]|uniref:autotransporter outer membrane beta-barrel domain-containing protein n=1 Tax=Paracoccus albus TaxID=3017784 RepID=UPI0022F06A46|nr:autotransporter outer membrane beta-barrel domain-containing protein [Paracoccus albus]WBU61206.1 autotransporter outer membrane beta-barrel domain-containing protein [Paracoccus albus]